ncbi:MAG: tetratricopeptide repeat protein [Bacteroidota bacterium]
MFNFRKNNVALVCICCLSIWAADAFSQKPTIDDIINVKTQLARSLVYSDAKRSERLADSVIQLGKKHNKLVAEAVGWNIKGVLKHFTSSPDSALKYFQYSEQLGIKANDKLIIAKAKQNKNLPLSQMGKYDQALKTCLEAVKLYEELGMLAAQAGCLGDVANILVLQERPADAITYLKEAIAISFRLNDESIRTNFYNSLGVAYSANKQPELAIKSYKDGLAIAQKLNNLKSQVNFNINIGEYVWEQNKSAGESLPYFVRAEKLALEYGDQAKLSLIYQNMGVIYDHQGNPAKAIELATKARDLALNTNQVYALEQIYKSLADYSKKSGNYSQAYQAFVSKDSLSRIIFDEKNNNSLNKLRTVYETGKKETEIRLLGNRNQIQLLQLGRNNLLISNNELELEKNKLFINNQSLSLSQKQDQLTQKQLEAVTKQQKIEILDAENQLQKLQLMKRNIVIIVVLGVLILLVFIAILIYNRYKIKQESKLQSEMLKQQDLATKAVIRAEENERQRIAGELHDGLGQLFSAVKMNLSGINDSIDFKDEHSKSIFSKTIDMVDESCREVRVISHQMAPNVLLKSGLTSAVRDFISKIDARKLKINLETFGLQERLDQNTEAVLYRVIQESVNNVIKHASASSLDIQLSKDEDGINAMIEDNGKGFLTRTSDASSGMGLKNMISRVTYLRGSVDVSSEPGKGTLVAIHIPL